MLGDNDVIVVISIVIVILGICGYNEFKGCVFF